MAHELDPVEVHTSDGELLARGFVREARGGTWEVSLTQELAAFARPGDDVLLEVKSAVRGACAYDAVVHAAAERTVTLVDVVLREAVQQRSAARVATALPHRAVQRTTGEDGAEETREVMVTVVDVSATGMRLRTPVLLPVGSRLSVVFTAARRPVELALEVVRVQEGDRETVVGCRYLDLPERDADELFRFVLDEQRRQLAVRKDAAGG